MEYEVFVNSPSSEDSESGVHIGELTGLLSVKHLYSFDGTRAHAYV